MVLLDSSVSSQGRPDSIKLTGLSSIWNVITFISLLASYFRLDIQHIAREKRIAALRSIDYIGMLLLIAGCALL